MPMSNYPMGFLQGVTIRDVPILQLFPGKVFWVNNSGVLPVGGIGASDGNSGNYLQPFATLKYAVSQCVAGRGDIIVLMPGHAESIATAAAIDINVSGVAVVGLGTGALRPTINITATAGYLKMSANNCALVNVLVTGGIDAITQCINITGADCYLELNYRDVVGQCTDCVIAAATATRLRIYVNEYEGDTAAGTNAGIALVGVARADISGRRMRGNFAVGGIDIRTTAATDLYVHDFVDFRTDSTANIFLVDTITGSTGQVGPNINLMLKTNAANITEAVTGATLIVQGPIYVCNNPGEQGMLINWTASTDA